MIMVQVGVVLRWADQPPVQGSKPLSFSKLDDYLDADAPQLRLHIVSFNDKILVSLYWPHTLMDAMGKRELLDAWTLMLGDEPTRYSHRKASTSIFWPSLAKYPQNNTSWRASVSRSSDSQGTASVISWTSFADRRTAWSASQSHHQYATRRSPG